MNSSRFYTPIILVLIMLTSPLSNGFENGTINVNEAWSSVDASGYTDPVLISGIATRNESEPGVISVIKDGSGGFSIRFREWDYLDGVHALESVSYLIIEKGHFARPDGVVIEAGTFNLTASKTTVFFNQEFDQTPIVFVSAQSENDPATYSLRTEGVTRFSFSASLDEQELNSGAHSQEEIAYLAIYSSTNAGQLDSSDNFQILQSILDDQPTSINGTQIFLEEEQSQNVELNHVDEVVSLFQTDGGFIGQTTTVYGGDTATVALRSVPTNSLTSCSAILNSDPAAQSGYYTLDVDGFGGLAPFSTYCDMDFDGGGWTLVAVSRGTQRLEATDIVDFSTDQYLADNVWQTLKASSSELYVYGYLSGRWVVAPFANITAGAPLVCVPLSDTLSASRIFHVESSGCDDGGKDYSMVGQSSVFDGLVNIWNFYGSVYSSTSGFTGTGKTDGVDMYVR